MHPPAFVQTPLVFPHRASQLPATGHEYAHPRGTACESARPASHERPSVAWRGLVPLVVALAAACLSACGGGDGGGGTPTQPGGQGGTLTLSIPTTAATVSIAGSTSITVAIVRGGSFSGTVALSVSGLPGGVTASFAPATLDPATSSAVLTITASANASAGNATLTISASGTGIATQTGSVPLIVTQPTIALAATPTALSIGAGLTGITTVSIGRSAGYTGAVTLTLDNPPAGITASFGTSPTTANSATVTLSVAASVAPGSRTVIVKATAPGAVDKTVALTVTVTAALPIGFTISVDPVEFDLPAGKGWSGYGVVNITRTNGFTGAVNVAVTPLLGSVGSAIVATPATVGAGDAATNLFALAADGTVPGVYAATVRATAPGFAEQQAQVRLRVSAPSTGAIAWTFCSASRVPRYFAVRDGNGAWQHVIPDGPAAATATTPTAFRFSLSQPTGAVAMVNLGEKTSTSPLIQGFRWEVYYMTAAEIADRASRECTLHPDATTRRATGSLTGYQSFDAVVVSASRKAIGFAGSTGGASTTVTVQNLQPGPFDLFMTRSSFSNGGSVPIVPQRLLLRRGLDPTSGGTLAPMDFTTEGVAPVTGVITMGNTNGETFYSISNFLTADGLNALFHAAGTYTATSRAWYGVPANKLLAGDLHQFVATTNNVSARRAVIAYGATVTSRSLDFGPALSAPNVAAGTTTAPWLVRATGTLSSDYANRASMYLRESIADPRAMMITATRGWLGAGNAYDVAVPDLSAATGFTAFWNLRRGAAVRWTVTGGEGDPGSADETFCILTGYCAVKAVDGAVYKSAQATGTVTIP